MISSRNSDARVSNPALAPLEIWSRFVLVAYILSSYLFETESGYAIFATTQLVTVGSGFACVIARNKLFGKWYIPWLAGIIAYATFLALMFGADTEYRTFIVNGVGVLACIQLISVAKGVRLALLSLSIAGAAASISLLMNLDRLAIANSELSSAWSYRAGDALPGGNPNIAGMYIAIAFGISIGMGLAKDVRVRNRLLYLALSLVCLGGVTTTGSRNALLFCAISLVIFIFLVRARLLPAVIFICFLGYTMLLRVQWLYVLVGHRFESGGATGRSDDFRRNAAREAWEGFSQSPFGSGLGSTDTFLSSLTYTHSNYLEILLSLGIVGLIFYYSLYARLTFGLWRDRTQTSMALLAPLLALVIYEVFQVTYLSKAPLLLLGIGMAHLGLLSQSPSTLRRTHAEREAPSAVGKSHLKRQALIKPGDCGPLNVDRGAHGRQ